MVTGDEARCLGDRCAPGRTRTPNLLIRRPPSRVHACPRASGEPGTTGFRVHRRPPVSGRVHREWTPTWLPARHATAGTRRFPTGARPTGPRRARWLIHFVSHPLPYNRTHVRI